MPLPSEVEVTSWHNEIFYDRIAKECFVTNPNERSSFKNVVDILENQLDGEHKLKYIALSHKYHLDKHVLMSHATPTSNGIKRSAQDPMTSNNTIMKYECNSPRIRGFYT